MTNESTRTHRRTVLRAGATAAWTAPVMVAVAAAPALAVSGATTLQVVNGQPVRSIDTSVPPRRVVLATTATVANVGAAATTALTVELRVTASSSVPDLSGSTAGAVSGFTGPVRVTDGQFRVFFTYAAIAQLAAPSTVLFNPTVTLSDETDGALLVTATPGNGPAAMMGIAFQ